MPLGRLLVGVAQATQQRFPKRFTDELQAQRQPVMAEATRDRQCRRAIEVIGAVKRKRAILKPSCGMGP